MKTHAIIEVEEGSLTLTIGGKVGNAARVFRCERFRVADVSQDTIANVLRGLGDEPLRGASGVHVIVGDRRAVHFSATVPKMPIGEVVDFVTREALRLSSLSAASDLLISPRLRKQLPGGRLEVSVSGLPASIWKPLDSALTAAGFAVLGLHTFESCLALAVPEGDSRVAVLELSGGRARFVLCDGGAAVQVRRFILGGVADGGSMAMAAQLAVELPRTYDWLRESGHAEPKVMLLGNRLRLDADSIEMLRGDLERIELAGFKWELEVDEPDAPSLATLMLMSRLFDDRDKPSLLAEPQISVPWSRSRVALIAAAGVVGAALTVHGLSDLDAYMVNRDEAALVRSEGDRLEQQALAAEAVAAPGVESPVSDPLLDLALSMRRPISRLIGEVSNSATEHVHLESLKFSSTEKAALRGVVKAESRQQALAVLTSFVMRLRALPYFDRDGQDEVQEIPGQPHCLRFVLGISWRNS